MADRIVEDADRIVDEMRRKARRRLVGAIVLALAAAILLPMLLEKEPRPLGDDVSVKIPPVDEGKFVNKLTGKSGESEALPKADKKADTKAAPPKAEPRSDAATTSTASAPAANAAPESVPAKKSIADSERAVMQATRASTKGAEALAAAPAETRIETKPYASEGSTPAPEEKPLTASAAPTQMAAPPASTAKGEGFVVQLAAFADDKGANSLANKLKKAGYAAFVEPVHTSRGTLWRVRVGGFGSKTDADAARAKLKGEGYSGIVAPAT
jgi:DedD protein